MFEVRFYWVCLQSSKLASVCITICDIQLSKHKTPETRVVQWMEWMEGLWLIKQM